MLSSNHFFQGPWHGTGISNSAFLSCELLISAFILREALLLCLLAAPCSPFQFQSFVLEHSGEDNGTPLQDSCLENPMDGGAWQAAVHGVVKSWTRLKRHSSSSSLEHSLTTMLRIWLFCNQILLIALSSIGAQFPWVQFHFSLDCCSLGISLIIFIFTTEIPVLTTSEGIAGNRVGRVSLLVNGLMVQKQSSQQLPTDLF